MISFLLNYRLASAFILIPAVITALFLLSPLLFANTILMIVCMLAAWEWGQLSYLTSCMNNVWILVLYSLLLIIIFLLQNHYNLYQSIIIYLLWASILWWFTALVLVLSYPYSAKIWCHSKLLKLVFGLLTIVPFFLSTLILRTWKCGNNHCSNSIMWLFYVMILVWVTDSGAYIVGKLFGKHKLLPKVSPKKTWQGFIGGLFATIIISWIYSFWKTLEVSSTILLIYSISISLAGVLGDLTESMFKREAGIKDSGCIIPGHGGMLDRIDSLTAAVPIFTYLLLY